MDDSSSTNEYDNVAIVGKMTVYESDDENLRSPPKKKSKKSHKQHAMSSFDDALTKFISAANAEPEKDEYELFGQSIASQLRKLPEENAIQFMGTSQQHLTKLRLEMIGTSASRVTSKSVGMTPTSSRQQPKSVHQPLSPAVSLCSQSLQKPQSSGTSTSSNSPWQSNLNNQQPITTPTS